MAQKAKRLATKLRIALVGPTGAGKTFSALRMAYGMVKAMHPNATEDQLWDKIYLIDSERGRGRAYAERTDLPMQTGSYWYSNIDAPYTPDKYMVALDEALETVGTDGVIICDSFTHVWNGEGGILDIKNDMDKKNPSGKYTAWNEVGSMQNKMVNKYLSAPSHLIVTMRTKMAYEMQTDENGKVRPIKIGLAPIQRGDLEYEFDICLMLNRDHIVDSVLKDITFLDNQHFSDTLTETVGTQLIQWVEQGVDPRVFEKQEKESIQTELKDLGSKYPELFTYFKTKFGNDALLSDLSLTELKNLLLEFKQMV